MGENEEKRGTKKVEKGEVCKKVTRKRKEMRGKLRKGKQV